MSALPFQLDPRGPDVPGVATADTVDVLGRIPESDLNLCIWRRPPVLAVAREVAALATHRRLDLRCRTSAPSFSKDVFSLLTEASLAPDAFGNWCADLEQLSSRFFDLAERRPVMERIETTDGDGCRRYHVDRSHLRLLCTYRGPGTGVVEQRTG